MEGTKFGRRTVIRRVFIESKRLQGPLYECVCECGQIANVLAKNLLKGKQHSCVQCLAKEKYSPDRAIGKTFGKWIVERLSEKKSNKQFYVCRCKDCGRMDDSRCYNDMFTERANMCAGCHQLIRHEISSTHGMSGTPTYRRWADMIRRCKNTRSKFWHRYGGRGISVRQSWESFDNFFNDMGECPKGYQLDRINNDGNYEPGNCRWCTPSENCLNRGWYSRGSRKGINKKS